MVFLEKLTLNHLVDCYYCIRTVFPKTSFANVKKSIIAGEINSSYHRFAIMDDSVFIGRLTLIDNKDSSYDLHCLIGKSHQKKGYATQAISQAIEKTKSLGGTVLKGSVAYTNIGSQKLVASHNFQKLSESSGLNFDYEKKLVK